MRTRIRTTATLAVFAMAVAACSGSAVEQQTPAAPAPAPQASAPADGGEPEIKGKITVGLINPLTGPFAALGEDVNRGFEMYVDLQGGVLSGYEIEILKEDTANDAAVAIEGIKRMISRGADVLVGFVNSGVAYGVSETILEADVPLIITTAGADDLTQRRSTDIIFRVAYTSSQDSMPLGDYACNALGYKTAVVVGLDYAFGWEAAGGFSKVFGDAGCTVVQELYAPLGTADWAPFVQQIDRSADVVWAVTPGADGIRFLQAYRDFGRTQPLIGHGSTTDEQILGAQGSNADGFISSLHYTTMIDSPANIQHREEFRSRYNASASQYSSNGQTAAMAIEAALALAGTADSAGIAASMYNVRLPDAPRGLTYFDSYGQAVYPVYIRRAVLKDGEWVNEIVETYDEVSQFWTYAPEQFMSTEPLATLRGTWQR